MWRGDRPSLRLFYYAAKIGISQDYAYRMTVGEIIQMWYYQSSYEEALSNEQEAYRSMKERQKLLDSKNNRTLSGWIDMYNVMVHCTDGDTIQPGEHGVNPKYGV